MATAAPPAADPAPFAHDAPHDARHDGTVRTHIGGVGVDGDGGWLDVHCPGDGRVIARTPLSTGRCSSGSWSR